VTLDAGPLVLVVACMAGCFGAHESTQPFEVELGARGYETGLRPLVDGGVLTVHIGPAGGWLAFLGARSDALEACTMESPCRATTSITLDAGPTLAPEESQPMRRPPDAAGWHELPVFLTHWWEAMDAIGDLDGQGATVTLEIVGAGRSTEPIAVHVTLRVEDL